MVSLAKLPDFRKADLRGKRVLVRVDFNVPFREGQIQDDFRLRRTLPTLRHLMGQKAQAILVTHLSLDAPGAMIAISHYLKKIFPTVVFIPGADLDLARGATKTLVPGELLLLDNIRLFEGEETNDESFARALAELAECYINDAMSVSHRTHASVVGAPRYLPHYAGALLLEEYERLSSVFNPRHPFLLILGGIKFESKLGILKRFLDIADTIFVGGALANNFFRALGEDVGVSAVDEAVDVLPFIGSPKIVLPIDKKGADGKILDIGPESVKFLSNLIAKAETILWNGPLGDYEVAGFDAGTKELIRLLVRSGAKITIGGGNTLDALKRSPEGASLTRRAFLSTAGGAMLTFLAEGSLPGLEALKN